MKKRFSCATIEKKFKELKKSPYFYDTTSQKAVEYLWYANDEYKKANSKKRYVGFFRSSPFQDCITFSVVNTDIEQINHCRYRILEDGSIVNLLNLMNERENVDKYLDLDQMADNLGKNMNLLTRDNIKKLIKISKKTT